MKSRHTGTRPVGAYRVLTLALVSFLLSPFLGAQTLPPEVEEMGYADTGLAIGFGVDSMPFALASCSPDPRLQALVERAEVVEQARAGSRVHRRIRPRSRARCGCCSRGPSPTA